MNSSRKKDKDDVETQRNYYRQTAEQYDDLHIAQNDEHGLALELMSTFIRQRGLASILDVGAGTGRVLCFLGKQEKLHLKGVEPSSELREIGYSKGLAREQLIKGDAMALDFPDNSFDLVCSFGVLHHIRDHQQAVSEMTRVARKAVFISDANNFGQGPFASRILKQVLRALKLWKLFDLVRTKGKGYHFSEGDGVYYSYSLFDDVPIIRSKFSDLFYMSTRPSGANLLRSAQTIALFASLPDEQKQNRKQIKE